MRPSCLIAVLVTLSAPALAAPKPAPVPAQKKQVVASIERQRPELVRLADAIWGYAETALREARSAKLLADHAEQHGFTVERGVAGMPTAFVATYGQGSPVIGILGEYDALPGLSQKAQPTREAVVADAPGHGCGHNLFGAASLGAAIAVKEQIAAGALKGTVRFFGTPAEEAVGGKIYMVRDGVFAGVDAVLVWHPSVETRADRVGGQALVDFEVVFRGRSSHAAYDPWNGRSALDAAELFTHAVNLMREHVKPSVRLHYVFAEGGNVPNVVPDRAKVWMWARDFTRDGVQDALERLRRAADGAALAAGVEAEFRIQSGDWEMLINDPGSRLLDRNLRWLGEPVYTAEEQAWARELQKAAGVPEKGVDASVGALEGQINEGGSTDVGDVSWVVPTLHVSVATAPAGIPWHAWTSVAASGHSIGHKGMERAAKVMAATAVDLMTDPKALAAVRADFAKNTEGVVYKPWIPDGPPPVPQP
ncbi:MAG: amidohydrolase [Vicinamibacteria bacterium]|nr:amidohydrolase [Vicinamibacteria bacterium]